jgi:conjugal transfer ATP-binding protein TraC
MKFDKGGLDRFLEQMGRLVISEPPPPDLPRGHLLPARLSDVLPYRSWDENRGLYESNKTVGFILEVVPLIGATDVTGRMLGELFTHSVPAGATVQVLSYASPKIGEVVDPWAHARAAQGGVFAAMAKHRREHFRNAAWRSASKQAPFYLRDFRIFLTVELPGSGSSMAADQLVEAREKFIADLQAMRTDAYPVAPRQLIATIGDILNPTTNIRPREVAFDDNRWINEQLVHNDTTWTIFRDRIEVRTRAEGDELVSNDATDDEVALRRELQAKDERFQIRGFSVKQFPEQWTQGAMSRILGDMFNDQLRLIGPTVVSLCFRSISAEKTRSTAEFKRMRTNQAASNPIGKMFPDTRKSAEDWTLVMEDVAEGALLAHLGMFVLSIAPVADAEKAERHLRGVFRNSRFVLQRDDDVHLQTVLACLPLTLAGGLFDDLGTCGRTRRMPTTVASRLAPLQGEFMGMDLPHVLLAGRRGQVMTWSPFANKSGNHNTAVVGASGSGKSVLMQEIAGSLRGAGAEVFVIDDGESFKNSSMLLGGAFIRFSLDLKTCINPFSIIEIEDGEGAESDYFVEGIEMIRLMIEQAARGSARCSDEEKGAIEQSVMTVWQREGRKGSFQSVIDELKASHGQRGEDLALAMSAYGTAGSYANFFNGEATLDITNSYTVFEMSDLEAKPDLRSVVVLAVLFLIRKRMKKGGRALKKALIIDEAWQMLSDGAVGRFIEGFARRCRKEGGAIITGTQSVNDYYKTDGARACMENSDHVVVLRLKEEALDQLRTNDRIKVTDADMTILKSLKVVDREYSEMFVMGPEARFLARLVLDPFSATLYSTTPVVFERIKSLQARGRTLEEAVGDIAFGQAA